MNRWRELGGLVAGDGDEASGEGTVVEAGDEAALRHGDWIYLVLGDETEEHLKAFEGEGGVTRVLDATFGKPGREGIESWGDWEIWVDRIDKTDSCASLVDLALHQLGASGEFRNETTKIRHNDGTAEERGAAMLDARAFMRSVEASWDAALSNIGENLEESMFGAEETEVECVVSLENDGNSRCFLVDAGPRMYMCFLDTS